ncbi:MAG: DsrE family protein [Nitrospiria bacterium]
MLKKKLGILLSTPPEHPNLQTVLSLVKEALRQQVAIYLYLVDEGVKNINLPEIAALPAAGAKLFVCAYGAQRRNIAIHGEAVSCGLVVLSDLVKGCDRFIAFHESADLYRGRSG